MLNWRLWYDLPGIGAVDTDICSYYDNTHGTWEDAPTQGVLQVAVRDRTGAWGRFINGWNPVDSCPLCNRWRTNEYFVKAPEDTDPQATPDLTPFITKMMHLGHNRTVIDKCIKYGRVTDQQHFNDVTLLAAKDPDFEILTPRRRHTDV